MKKYLYNYVNSIDEIIKNNSVTKEIIEEHLIKINFFQHERLIHLIVTSIYSIIFVISMVAALYNIIFCFVGLIFTCFLLPYVIYYFQLENKVQYLYKQYDKMKELI